MPTPVPAPTPPASTPKFIQIAAASAGWSRGTSSTPAQKLHIEMERQQHQRERQKTLHKLVMKLAALSARAVEHHGHGCGFGHFRGRSNEKKRLNFCDICTPLSKQIDRVRKFLREGI